VFNLIPVRALPDADFAGFPTGFGFGQLRDLDDFACVTDRQETNERRH